MYKYIPVIIHMIHMHVYIYIYTYKYCISMYIVQNTPTYLSILNMNCNRTAYKLHKLHKRNSEIATKRNHFYPGN